MIIPVGAQRCSAAVQVDRTPQAAVAKYWPSSWSWRTARAGRRKGLCVGTTGARRGRLREHVSRGKNACGCAWSSMRSIASQHDDPHQLPCLRAPYRTPQPNNAAVARRVTAGRPARNNTGKFGHDKLCKKIKKRGRRATQRKYKYAEAVLAAAACAGPGPSATPARGRPWRTGEGLVRGCACGDRDGVASGRTGVAHVSSGGAGEDFVRGGEGTNLDDEA